MASSDFTDAFVHYCTMFPTLLSLGVDAATWLAELNAVSPAAFDAVLATQLAFEGGGNMGGQRNFDQMHKVRALHAVRALRDGTYVNPYTLAVPAALPGVRIGTVVRLGY